MKENYSFLSSSPQQVVTIGNREGEEKSAYPLQRALWLVTVLNDTGLKITWGFRSGSGVKNPPANARDVRSLGQEDPLEKEMIIHSSILAWETHGQWSLGGYRPWDHKRVGHDLATKQQK